MRVFSAEGEKGLGSQRGGGRGACVCLDLRPNRIDFSTAVLCFVFFTLALLCLRLHLLSVSDPSGIITPPSLGFGHRPVVSCLAAVRRRRVETIRWHIYGRTVYD